MRTLKVAGCTIVAAVIVTLFAGCRHSNTVDTEAFKSALNDFYHTRQICLWDGSIKLPAEADASNDNETRQFDALTDAGMLTRIPAEKKRFLVGSKRVNTYDLSDNGRKNWTPESAQPGYGNFCFGRRKVDSILAYSPETSGATQYSVTYRSTVPVPDWANNAEIKTAFPQVGRDVAGANASATLTKSGEGWTVEKVSQQ